MHAILVSTENLEKILAHYESAFRASPFNLDMFLQHKADWFYVQGYVDKSGKLIDWATFPEQTFKDNFEYDPVKIRTDWDQIVRLNHSPDNGRLPYKD